MDWEMSYVEFLRTRKKESLVSGKKWWTGNHLKHFMVDYDLYIELYPEDDFDYQTLFDDHDDLFNPNELCAGSKLRRDISIWVTKRS